MQGRAARKQPALCLLSPTSFMDPGVHPVIGWAVATLARASRQTATKAAAARSMPQGLVGGGGGSWGWPGAAPAARGGGFVTAIYCNRLARVWRSERPHRECSHCRPSLDSVAACWCAGRLAQRQAADAPCRTHKRVPAGIWPASVIVGQPAANNHCHPPTFLHTLVCLVLLRCSTAGYEQKIRRNGCPGSPRVGL